MPGIDGHLMENTSLQRNLSSRSGRAGMGWGIRKGCATESKTRKWKKKKKNSTSCKTRLFSNLLKGFACPGREEGTNE